MRGFRMCFINLCLRMLVLRADCLYAGRLQRILDSDEAPKLP